MTTTIITASTNPIPTTIAQPPQVSCSVLTSGITRSRIPPGEIQRRGAVVALVDSIRDH